MKRWFLDHFVLTLVLELIVLTLALPWIFLGLHTYFEWVMG